MFPFLHYQMTAASRSVRQMHQSYFIITYSPCFANILFYTWKSGVRLVYYYSHPHRVLTAMNPAH